MPWTEKLDFSDCGGSEGDKMSANRNLGEGRSAAGLRDYVMVQVAETGSTGTGQQGTARHSSVPPLGHFSFVIGHLPISLHLTATNQRVKLRLD